VKKVCFWFDSQSRKSNVWQNIDSEFLNFDLLVNMPFNYEIKFRNKDEVDTRDLNFYLIELRYQNLTTFKKFLKKTVTQFLKNNPSIVIMFYMPAEAGFLGAGEKPLFLIFDQMFSDLENQKYLIYGALNVKQLTPTKFVDKVIGFDYFEYWTYRKLNSIPVKNTNPSRNFLCLNRRLTDSRIALLALLYKKNLYNTNYVSNLNFLPKQFKHLSKEDLYIRAKEILFDADKKFVNKILEDPPLILDYDPSTLTSEIYPLEGTEQYYEKTYFSLVTETCIDRLFLTEKVYKCIARGHPFIVWGAPFLLDYLKSKGYETYSSVFDESYDIEIDDQKRLYKIIESVEKFISLPSNEKAYKHRILQRIAEYNRTLFLERAEYNYKKQWQKTIEKISNDQKN